MIENEALRARIRMDMQTPSYSVIITIKLSFVVYSYGWLSLPCFTSWFWLFSEY